MIYLIYKLRGGNNNDNNDTRKIQRITNTDDEDVLAELHDDYLKLKEMLEC